LGILKEKIEFDARNQLTVISIRTEGNSGNCDWRFLILSSSKTISHEKFRYLSGIRWKFVDLSGRYYLRVQAWSLKLKMSTLNIGINHSRLTTSTQKFPLQRQICDMNIEIILVNNKLFPLYA